MQGRKVSQGGTKFAVNMTGAGDDGGAFVHTEVKAGRALFISSSRGVELDGRAARRDLHRSEPTEMGFSKHDRGMEVEEDGEVPRRE